MAQTMNTDNTRCAEEKGDSETKTPLLSIVGEKDYTRAEELKNKANEFFKGLYVGRLGFLATLDCGCDLFTLT